MNDLEQNLESLSGDENDKVRYGRQTNDVEMELRVEQVRKWLLECRSRVDICRMGSSAWGVNYRAVDGYIARARQDIASYKLEEFEERLTKAIQESEHLYAECLTNNDRRNATAAKKHLDFLRGLMIQRVDVTSKGESINRIIQIIEPGASNNTSV